MQCFIHLATEAQSSSIIQTKQQIHVWSLGEWSWCAHQRIHPVDFKIKCEQCILTYISRKSSPQYGNSIDTVIRTVSPALPNELSNCPVPYLYKSWNETSSINQLHVTNTQKKGNYHILKDFKKYFYSNIHFEIDMFY